MAEIEKIDADTKNKGSFFQKLLDIINSLTGIVDYVMKEADDEIQKIRKQILHYMIVVVSLASAVLFIVVGAIIYLSEIFNFSEGLLFIIAGCIIIVVMAFLSLLKQV